MTDHPTLKRWLVCRLECRFDDLGAANAYAAQHAPRFLHVLPESRGKASVWALVAHCEREATAHHQHARLAVGAPDRVAYAVLRAGRRS